MDSISLRNYKGFQNYDTNNIIRIEGKSNYCKIFFADDTKTLTVAKLLQWFEKKLPANLFLRTHKTHLVNSMYIQKMNISTKSFLILQNGEYISVSRRKAKLLKASA